eukprot:6005801-Pyramimonas_sp.AAC.1
MLCENPLTTWLLLVICRYVAHIRANAERYMHEKLGIPLDQVGPVRKKALALANQVPLATHPNKP